MIKWFTLVSPVVSRTRWNCHISDHSLKDVLNMWIDENSRLSLGWWKNDKREEVGAVFEFQEGAMCLEDKVRSCNSVSLDNGAEGTGRGAKGCNEETIIFLRNKRDNFSPDKNYLLPSQSNHHCVPLFCHTPLFPYYLLIVVSYHCFCVTSCGPHLPLLLIHGMAIVNIVFPMHQHETALCNMACLGLAADLEPHRAPSSK